VSVDRIPIQNIYFLLCYAWNHLQEAQYAEARSEDCDKVWDLLAKVLIRSSQQLVKRGLHRNYILRRESLVRPKGKILAAEEIRRPSFGNLARTCEYDDLSPDILPNQIINATFHLLLRHDDLSPDIRKELREWAPFWANFKRPKVTPRTFRRVHIHRNMRHYRFVLNICELIHREYLPEDGEGSSHFRDFLRDEATMSKLFEQFVRNFLAKEQSTYKVTASQVKWNFNPEESSTGGIRLLPIMQTDVFLVSPEHKLIIDCKYYQKSFQNTYDTDKFHSGNLYQILSYLTNQSTQPGFENVRGMLLYPTVGESFDEHVTIQGHQIRLATINLDQDWEGVARDLLGLVGNPI
jgi:5-methylcytosine-specific restriction enzyme subunit McrC